jgi:hypothetical protein
VVTSRGDACSTSVVGAAWPPPEKLLVSWQLMATSAKIMLAVSIVKIALVFTVTDSVDFLLLLLRR